MAEGVGYGLGGGVWLRGWGMAEVWGMGGWSLRGWGMAEGVGYG